MKKGKAAMTGEYQMLSTFKMTSKKNAEESCCEEWEWEWEWD